MGFSDDTVKRRFFNQAEAQCESCHKDLIFSDRGCANPRKGWEAHHKKPVSEGGSDDIRNCRILCCICHRRAGRVFEGNNPRKTTGAKKSKKDDDEELSGWGLWAREL